MLNYPELENSKKQKDKTACRDGQQRAVFCGGHCQLLLFVRPTLNVINTLRWFNTGYAR